MAKKILAIALIAIVAVSAAACFVACEEEPTPYADLVAVRVNNFMAEWENIDYNFTYEGSSALKVSVPYTNYLEVNDLIVSPGAEYKVYEDEGKTKQLTDLSKIYVDGAKTLYIDVTNGELSNSYSVDVTVEQTNLPPESETADKQYDNRGGHIYIPEGAETVVIDGVEYGVVRHEGDAHELIDANKNIILDGELQIRWQAESYSAIFNGNNHYIYPTSEKIIVDRLESTGIVKNALFARYEDLVGNTNRFAQVVCKYNYGTIDNVKIDIHYYDHHHPFAHGGDWIEDKTAKYGYYCFENHGSIKNCLNVGNLTSRRNNIFSQMASFVTRQCGTMENCVNTGEVQYAHPSYLTEDWDVGASAIAYSTDDEAIYRGVYNLGKVSMDEYKKDPSDRQLHGLVFKTIEEGKYPDLSKTRNYL